MDQNGDFWDDVSGAKLNKQKIQEARLEEIKQLYKHKVYKKVPISQCWAETGKAPIKVKWIDINKGDDANPVYRSRMVGKEFNNEAMDGIFAGTPPLDAMRCLVHEAATIQSTNDQYSKVIMINDVQGHSLKPLLLDKSA